MSDPCGRLGGMDETCVTATDFRSHLTDLANSVADGGQRVVMARHGYRMVALVSQEDLQFLREHKPLAGPGATSGPVIPERLPHPERLQTDELERLYQETKGRDELLDWRGKAWLALRLRKRCTVDYPI